MLVTINFLASPLGLFFNTDFLPDFAFSYWPEFSYKNNWIQANSLEWAFVPFET